MFGTTGETYVRITFIVICALGFSALIFLLAAKAGVTVDLLTTLQTEERGYGGGTFKTTFNPLGIIFFAFITGICSYLVARVLGLMTGREAGAGAANPSPASLAQVEQAEGAVRSEIEKLLGFVRTHMISSETHAKALAGAQEKLNALAEPEHVHLIVRLLVTENERMRRDTKQLSQKLEQSQSHIEQLRASLSRAQEEGQRDPLTNVGNRRLFDVTVDAATRTAAESGDTLSIVMCDIDHFKKINDTYGHAVGDEVLKMFARVIADNVRDGDTVARYGGEEFVVVLPGARQEGAIKLADRVRRQFADKRLTLRSSNQQLGMLTASFGVAELRAGETCRSLVERADVKLYEAKKAGRNRVASFDS